LVFGILSKADVLVEMKSPILQHKQVHQVAARLEETHALPQVLIRFIILWITLMIAACIHFLKAKLIEWLLK